MLTGNFADILRGGVETFYRQSVDRVYLIEYGLLVLGRIRPVPSQSYIPHRLRRDKMIDYQTRGNMERHPSNYPAWRDFEDPGHAAPKEQELIVKGYDLR